MSTTTTEITGVLPRIDDLFYIPYVGQHRARGLRRFAVGSSIRRAHDAKHAACEDGVNSARLVLGAS